MTEKSKINETIPVDIKIANITASEGSVASGMIISEGISIVNSDNVTILVSLIGAAIGVTTTAINGIKLWVDERKTRRLKVKYQDIELEIYGTMSESEIKKQLEIFHTLKDDLKKDDVKIIVDGND